MYAQWENFPVRNWWPRTDTESRIKAFDKLIDYYNPKGV